MGKLLVTLFASPLYHDVSTDSVVNPSKLCGLSEWQKLRPLVSASLSRGTAALRKHRAPQQNISPTVSIQISSVKNCTTNKFVIYLVYKKQR